MKIKTLKLKITNNWKQPKNENWSILSVIIETLAFSSAYSSEILWALSNHCL